MNSDPNGAAADQDDVTALLARATAGDEAALEKVVPLVYAELRRRASFYMRGERPDHTLGTTGLIHETFLRLRDQDRARFANRGQFLAVALELYLCPVIDI